MISTVFKFKGYIVFVMLLLLSQQSFAAFFPMTCDGMKDASIGQTEHSSHMTSKMDMSNPQSQDKMTSHAKCDICDSGECQCSEFTRCLSSSVSIAAQVMNLDYALFVSHGKRFISSDEYPDSGNYLPPFRPPVSISIQDQCA